MTLRQEKFVDEYIACDGNATQAAIKAGFTAKHARVTATKLLAKPHIRQEIEQRKTALFERAKLTPELVLRELTWLATSNIRDFYDEQGKLKPVKQWTRRMGAQVKSIETLRRNVTAGDNATDEVFRIQFWPKDRAAETLAKHLGLLVEQQQIDTQVTFSWETRPAVVEAEVEQIPAETVTDADE